MWLVCKSQPNSTVPHTKKKKLKSNFYSTIQSHPDDNADYPFWMLIVSFLSNNSIWVTFWL